MKFDINITTLTLLIALLISIMVGLNLFKAKRAAERKAKSAYEMTVAYSDQFLAYKKFEKAYRDSLKAYQNELDSIYFQVEQKNTEIYAISRKFEAFKEEVRQIPYDSSYAFLRSIWAETDSLEFPFSGNQVEELHLVYYDRIECEEVVSTLEQENELLLESIANYGELVSMGEDRLSECDESLNDLQEEAEEILKDGAKAQKKLKRNRILAGIATAIAIVAFL